MVSLRNKRKKQNKTRRIKGGVGTVTWEYLFNKFNEKITGVLFSQKLVETGVFNNASILYSMKTVKVYLDSIRLVPNVDKQCEIKYYQDQKCIPNNSWSYLYDKKLVNMTPTEKEKWLDNFYKFLLFVYEEPVLNQIGINTDNKKLYGEMFLQYFIKLASLIDEINDPLFGSKTIQLISDLSNRFIPEFIPIKNVLFYRNWESFRNLIKHILEGKLTLKVE